MASHLGPWAARRVRNDGQSCVDHGDQPSSAMAGSRGNAMNSMWSLISSVSDHSGASTPRTAASGRSSTYAPGFQSYASSTSVKPAHDRPSGVFSSYFMSRYALFAGDSRILLPAAAAPVTRSLVVSVPQNWPTADVGGVAFR